MVPKAFSVLAMLTPAFFFQAAISNAPAQDIAPVVASNLLDGFEVLKSASSDGSNAFMAVGVLRKPVTEGFHREGAAVWITPDGKVSRRTLLPPPDAGAVGTDPYAVLRLTDGSYVIVGASWYGTGEPRYMNLQAWAARISASGGKMWSRSYGDASQQLFRFVHINGANEIVAGGRTQAVEIQTSKSNPGSACRWSQGLLQRIDLRTGDALGPPRQSGDQVSRRAYWASTPASNGEMVAVGFISAKSVDLDIPCQDDVLVERIGLDGRQLGRKVLPLSSGNDVAIDILPTQSGYLAVGYAEDSANRQKGLLLPLAQNLAPLSPPNLYEGPNGEGGRLDFIVSLPPSATYMAGGFTRARDKDVRHPLLVVVNDVGAVSATTIIKTHPSARAFAAAVATSGRVLVVGQGWNQPSIKLSESEGWLAILDMRRAPNHPNPAQPAGPVVPAAPPPSAQLPSRLQKSFSLLPNVQGVYNLAELPQNEIIIENGRVSAGSPIRVVFSVAQETRAFLSVQPTSGDPDLLLLSSNGALIDYSTNFGKATELVAADLTPGSYELAIVTAAGSAQFSLVLGKRPPAHPKNEVAQLDRVIRERIAQRFEALGYSPGTNPSVGFAVEAERAIAAYQLSRRVPATGELTKAQVDALLRELVEETSSPNRR